MKNTKKYIWLTFGIFTLIIILYILYLIFHPYSYMEMRSIAIDQFNENIKTMNIKRDLFQGPFIKTDSQYAINPNSKHDDYLVFQWTAIDRNDTLIIGIYVPPYFYKEPFYTDKGLWEKFSNK